MISLPSGLADPLHLDFPVPWKLIAVIALLFLAIVAFLLLRIWLERRRRAPSKPPLPPVPTAGFSVFDAIEEIRERHGPTGSFRVACHELSTLLRRYFERSSRHRFSTFTAGEIHRELGETRTSRFFSFLAELQFGRGRPSRNDLDGACDLAIEVAKEKSR